MVDIYQVVGAGPIEPPVDPPETAKSPFVYVWLVDQANTLIPCFAGPQSASQVLAVALAALARQAPVQAWFASELTPSMPRQPTGMYQLYSLFVVTAGSALDPPPVVIVPPPRCTAEREALQSLQNQMAVLQNELKTAVGDARGEIIQKIDALQPKIEAAQAAYDACVKSHG